MRIGIISSSGGSAFLEASIACPHVEFVVLTDRPCGIEHGCKARGIDCIRIENKSNTAFSRLAADTLSQGAAVDVVVLFFTRLVTAPLLDRFTVLNIHPSLLPAFKGLNAVDAARRSGARFFGATLHVADDTPDRGPIIAQACQPIESGTTIERLRTASFIHKVSLFLLAVDLLESGHLSVRGGCPSFDFPLPSHPHLNPMIGNNDYLSHIRSLQAHERVEFL